MSVQFMAREGILTRSDSAIASPTNHSIISTVKSGTRRYIYRKWGRQHRQTTTSGEHYG